MRQATPIRASLAALACTGLLAAAVAGCRGDARAPAVQEETMPHRSIAEVIAAHADSLMAVPGVVGIYEGRMDDGTPCVKIMVVRLDDALRARLPGTLGGYPVLVEETGEIRAMPDEAP